MADRNLDQRFDLLESQIRELMLTNQRRDREKLANAKKDMFFRERVRRINRMLKHDAPLCIVATECKLLLADLNRAMEQERKIDNAI